jgi:hypothetical protein
MEALGGSCDLAAAPGELLDQLARHAGELEVAPILASRAPDLIALASELLGERRAVVGAELACGAEDRPRRDGDDPLVLANHAADHDMTVQLRVGRLRAADAAGRRVSVLGSDHVLGPLLDDLAVVAAAHHRDLLAQIPDSALDGPCVRLLDRAATNRRAPTRSRPTLAR